MKAPAVIGVFVAKPITRMNEKTAYRMNNQRIVLLSGEEFYNQFLRGYVDFAEYDQVNV